LSPGPAGSAAACSASRVVPIPAARSARPPAPARRLADLGKLGSAPGELGQLTAGPRGLQRGRRPVPARPRHQRTDRRPGRHGRQLPQSRQPGKSLWRSGYRSHPMARKALEIWLHLGVSQAVIDLRDLATYRRELGAGPFTSILARLPIPPIWLRRLHPCLMSCTRPTTTWRDSAADPYGMASREASPFSVSPIRDNGALPDQEITTSATSG